jgi:hypothetical protein
MRKFKWMMRYKNQKNLPMMETGKSFLGEGFSSQLGIALDGRRRWAIERHQQGAWPQQLLQLMKQTALVWPSRMNGPTAFRPSSVPPQKHHFQIEVWIHFQIEVWIQNGVSSLAAAAP